MNIPILLVHIFIVHQSDIENREVLRVLNLNEVDAANLSSVFTRCSTGKGPGSTIISIMNLRSPRGHYSTKCYVKVIEVNCTES